LPSGGTTRATRWNSSRRSQSRRKNETPSVESSTIPDLVKRASISLSQPSRSIQRSGTRKSKPYDNTEEAREQKSFNDAVWDLASQWFVLKLWRESCFFIKADVEDTIVDRCATEAYEAAISEYRDSHQLDAAALITKYRLQPQATGALVKCRKVVSPVIVTIGTSIF
jgi:hypothetical protein